MVGWVDVCITQVTQLQKSIKDKFLLTPGRAALYEDVVERGLWYGAWSDEIHPPVTRLVVSLVVHQLKARVTRLRSLEHEPYAVEVEIRLTYHRM